MERHRRSMSARWCGEGRFPSLTPLATGHDEVRSISGMSEEMVISELERALATAGLADRVRIEPVVGTSWIPAGETVSDRPLLDAAVRAWRSVIGAEPNRAVLPAGTDSSLVDALGIPTLPALGPERRGSAPAERIPPPRRSSPRDRPPRTPGSRLSDRGSRMSAKNGAPSSPMQSRSSAPSWSRRSARSYRFRHRAEFPRREPRSASRARGRGLEADR